jgi:hypothetical protein
MKEFVMYYRCSNGHGWYDNQMDFQAETFEQACEFARLYVKHALSSESELCGVKLK